MRKRLIIFILATLASLCTVPASSYASSNNDDDAPKLDARLDGYKQGNMDLKEASGTGLTWVLLVILGGMCIGVMFMNSKRTHLD
jgi:hypothetical protein